MRSELESQLERVGKELKGARGELEGVREGMRERERRSRERMEARERRDGEERRKLEEENLQAKALVKVYLIEEGLLSWNLYKNESL